MKVCDSCKEGKEEADFPFFPRKSEGRQPVCAACRTKQRQTAYYERNRVVCIERTVAWRAGNRERSNASRRAWRMSHPEAQRTEGKKRREGMSEAVREKRRQACASYYTKNKAEMLAAMRARSAKSPEAGRERARKWHKEHPEESRERVAEWAKANPDKMQAIRLRRRGFLRSAGDADPAHLAKLLSEPCCAYCEVEFQPCSMRERTIDHVRPLVRGGTNATENLLAACRRCNSQKNRKTLEEWVATGRAPKGVGKRLARVDT